MDKLSEAIIGHRKKFGKFLIGLRVEANLTQRDVSDCLGYSSAQFVSNIERGISTTPITTAVRMAEIFKAPVNKVVEEYCGMEVNILKEHAKRVSVPVKLAEKAGTRRKVRAKEVE